MWCSVVPVCVPGGRGDDGGVWCGVVRLLNPPPAQWREAHRVCVCAGKHTLKTASHLTAVVPSVRPTTPAKRQRADGSSTQYGSTSCVCAGKQAEGGRES